jgi:hypothetical protein
VEKVSNTLKRKCSGMGYNVDNRTIYTLQSADDQVVNAQSKEDLEYKCRKLQEECFKYGLTMNIVKTKYMFWGSDTNYLEMDNSDIITDCTKFRYLGTILPKTEETLKYTSQGNTSTESDRCIEWGVVVKEHNKKPEKDYL